MTTIPNLNPIPAVTGDDYLITHDITTNRSGRVSVNALKQHVSQEIISDQDITAALVPYADTNVEQALNQRVKTVNTFADLNPTGMVVGDVVYLKEYYSGCHVGGGYFIVEPYDGHGSNGGSIVTNGVLSLIRMQQYYSSLTTYMFGALGKGALETTQLQNFLNAIDGSGGGGLVEHGTYLTGPLVLNGTWRRIYSNATAVGLPGAQFVAATPGITILDANMETIALENLSFNSGELGDPRGVTSTVGVHLRQGGGAIQQDDARIVNCWFAGFGRAGIVAPKLQGCHITNCTFEFSGSGIECQSTTEDLIFYQNIIHGCRFYRNLRHIWLGSKARSDRYLTDIKLNTISSCIFDFGGRYGGADPGVAGISFYGEASYNTVTGCQFKTQMCDDILIQNSQGNIITGNHFHRVGKAALRLINADNTHIVTNWIDNPNGGLAEHLEANYAIEISESQKVKISVLDVFNYGVPGMVGSIRAQNNSTVSLSQTNLANGTGGSVLATSGSEIFNNDVVKGVWTPLLQSTGGGGVASQTQQGSYSIVGDEVTLKGEITVVTKGASMVGTVFIAGNPFTVQTGDFFNCWPKISNFNFDPVSGDKIIVSSDGTVSLQLQVISDNNPTVDMVHSYIKDGSKISFNARFNIALTGNININN